MVETVDDSNIDTFLNGWNLDNRVRVLLFGKTDVIRLRYLTTAFKYRNRALLGYVKLQGPNTDKLIERFKVPTTNVDTLLIFQVCKMSKNIHRNLTVVDHFQAHLFVF